MPTPMTETSLPAATVAPPRYGAQLTFVRTMLPILGGLLEAGSEVDPVVKREIDLPRPRDIEVTYTAAFTDIVHELRSHIGGVRSPLGKPAEHAEGAAP